ncbi:MAG: magnesium transporter CorA family protein, partial [Planctomycetia bacterium]|nr:magnesium transporter CorA family protein [Planctomycetia bacterium]
PPGPEGGQAMKTVVEFDFEAKRERSIALESALDACEQGRFCWIDLDAEGDRAEAEAVLRGLGVDGRAVERALSGHDDGRHDFFDDVVHLTVSAAEISEGVLVTSPVDFLLGRSFLVSLHRGEPEFLGEVRRSYRVDFRTFALSPGFLLYELWDHLIASYKKTTRGLCDRVRDLQRRISGGDGDAIFARVAAASADLLTMRRVLLAAREVLSELCTRRSSAVAETTRPFLEKMVSTIERVVADLTVERETVAEALNLYLAVVTYKTNEVVNRLTVVSLVFLPLTFLCGVYGMNFKYLPEVEWRYGYTFFWVTAAVVATSTLTVMKRLGWW